MVSRLARLEVELCSTTRGLPVPSLTLTPAKLNPFLVARFPYGLPRGSSGSGVKLGSFGNAFTPAVLHAHARYIRVPATPPSSSGNPQLLVETLGTVPNGCPRPPRTLRTTSRNPSDDYPDDYSPTSPSGFIMLVMGTEFGYAEPMTTLSTTPTTTPRYSSEAVVLQRRSVQLRREQLHELSEQAQLELADEWLRSFPSVNTRDAYARDFRDFRLFLSFIGVRNFGEVTRADGNEYRNYLDELKDPTGKPYSQATKHRKLASVASFYDYCLAEQLLPFSPLANVKRPKVSKLSPRSSLSKAQAQDLLRLVEDKSPSLRALVALTLLGGLRVSEALSVTASSFAYKDGHTVAQIQRKGDKPDEVPLSPFAIRLLDEALDASKADGLPLVRTQAGGVMLRQQASKELARLGRLAGLPFTLVPHSLRHTAGTLADEAGAPLERVQTFLGHENTETTLRYLRSRKRLDNSASYTLSSYLSEGL